MSNQSGETSAEARKKIVQDLTIDRQSEIFRASDNFVNSLKQLKLSFPRQMGSIWRIYLPATSALVA